MGWERGEDRKRTDGRGLEVNGGQLAAGGLRELRHHTSQGPILSLQPLLHLAQGLNLLYLGEVLQEGGEQRGREEGSVTERNQGRGLMKDRTTEIKREGKRKQKRKTVRKWGQL